MRELYQLVSLFLLAIPVAWAAWTVTHEEVFREPREWLAERSRTCPHWWQRKAYYVWTREYCFSHYVAIAFVALTDYQLLLPDWRGYVRTTISASQIRADFRALPTVTEHGAAASTLASFVINDGLPGLNRV